ncbi:hypothetical protein TURU_138582 [Turdus rufiventris]|nr:hypothetical protein TURU_138582 [Turdus rufiventris]
MTVVAATHLLQNQDCFISGFIFHETFELFILRIGNQQLGYGGIQKTRAHIASILILRVISFGTLDGIAGQSRNNVSLREPSDDSCGCYFTLGIQYPLADSSTTSSAQPPSVHVGMVSLTHPVFPPKLQFHLEGTNNTYVRRLHFFGQTTRYYGKFQIHLFHQGFDAFGFVRTHGIEKQQCRQLVEEHIRSMSINFRPHYLFIQPFGFTATTIPFGFL